MVDDSAAIRKVLQRVLRQAAIPLEQVHEAADGPKALEKFKAERIDLVLAEIHMSKMDGLELLGRLKATDEWRHPPVILVTTEGSQSRALEAAQLGAAGYVRKPFTVEQIRRALHEFV
jgi:two-component system chemotaxis response regulator CheY